MREYIYSIYGVSLKLTTNSLAMAAVVQVLLSDYPQQALNHPFVLEAIFKEVHNRTEIPVEVSSSPRILFESEVIADNPLLSAWRYKIYRDIYERQVIDFLDLGILLIDHQQGRVEVYLVDPDVIHPELQTNICHIALTELIKQRNIYTIHAAALEKEGHGILICGYSGQGKSTSCISLLRAGYRCLSDDHPLLRKNGNRFELLPFMTNIGATEKTIEFFPELKNAKKYSHQGIRKHHFSVESLYPHYKAEPCQPALLIFPQIVDWSKSRIELLPRRIALQNLLPQVLLVSDRDATKQQFQIFSELVSKVTCYLLYFGKDVSELPQLIDPLLDDI